MTNSRLIDSADLDKWEVHKRDNALLATVCGWNTRYANYPRIATQAAKALAGQSHRLLYRGQKSIDHIDSVFTIGQKARPLYHKGDLAKLKRRLSKLAANRTQFGELVGAFLGSGVGNQSTLTFEELLRNFDRSNETTRVVMAQILLEALQYRNCKLTGKEWRDYLFLLSASTNPKRAAMYALQRNPKEAFILEYAPPIGRNLARSVKHFRTEYSALGLGETPTDDDEEYFIRYGMLPHFLLGYTRFVRVGTEAPYSYIATFVPNPVYANGSSTLDRPPNLDAAQEAVFRETLPSIAWVFNRADGELAGWTHMQSIGGTEPLDPRIPTVFLEETGLNGSQSLDNPNDA